MAIKASGALSFSDLSAEFGGAAPYSLSQYYRGGARVPSGPSQNANIATAGAISMGQFYGAVKGFVFNQTLTGSVANYNLRNAAIAAGWNGVLPLIASITIQAGATVYASSTGTYAFDTDTSYPAGSTLAVTNNGVIAGCGGAGGQVWGDNNGSTGGPGMLLRAAGLALVNNGYIVGGGGGGGIGGGKHDSSGDAWHYPGGGGGGGVALVISAACTITNGSGTIGGGGYGGSGGAADANIGGTYGGSGGGGAGNGIGGSPGAGIYGGTQGGNGSVTSGGAGSTPNGGAYGQNGGGLGSSGAAVSGNSNATWVSAGTRLGAIA